MFNRLQFALGGFTYRPGHSCGLKLATLSNASHVAVALDSDYPRWITTTLTGKGSAWCSLLLAISIAALLVSVGGILLGA